MSPPKKKKAQPFMGFALKWKAKQLHKYGKNYSLEEAVSRAGEIWAKMPPDEKEYYKDVAKLPEPVYNNAPLNNKTKERLTSLGIPFSEIESSKRRKDISERIMKKDIEDIVKKSRLNHNFSAQCYYFVSANYFVRPTADLNNYVPAEIALAEFTLKDGVQNKYHSYVSPGDVMFGKVFQAKEHTNLTHRLPLPPEALGEKDLGKLYVEISKFINPDGKTENYKPPPLFTTTDDVQMVQKILDLFVQDCFEDDIPEKITVYPMQYLFYVLKKATAEIGEHDPLQDIYITDAILEHDKYDYQNGISCDHHEKIDRGKYCALSRCIRWCFLFAENLCLDVAIDLKPGYHAPIDIDPIVIQVQKPFRNNEEINKVMKSRKLNDRTHPSTSSKNQPDSNDFQLQNIKKEDRSFERKHQRSESFSDTTNKKRSRWDT